MVWRAGSAAVGHGSPARYASAMGTLRIEVGDLHFSARWEAAAPRTIEAIRRMLPIESKLIHCRWTGESTWIPFGDFRPGLDYENHTSHPAPGQLAIYPGGISECEIFFPYGGCTTASKVGPAGGQPLRLGVRDRDRRRLAGSPARDGPADAVGRRPADPASTSSTTESACDGGDAPRARGGEAVVAMTFGRISGCGRRAAVTSDDRPRHPRRHGRHGDRFARRRRRRSTAASSRRSSPTCPDRRPARTG